jgi:hypothetical protein
MGYTTSRRVVQGQSDWRAERFFRRFPRKVFAQVEALTNTWCWARHRCGLEFAPYRICCWKCGVVCSRAASPVGFSEPSFSYHFGCYAEAAVDRTFVGKVSIVVPSWCPGSDPFHRDIRKSLGLVARALALDAAIQCRAGRGDCGASAEGEKLIEVAGTRLLGWLQENDHWAYLRLVDGSSGSGGSSRGEPLP